MRVEIGRDSQVSAVASHVGGRMPGHATTHPAAEAINTMGDSAYSASMLGLWLVRCAFIMQLGSRHMAPVIYAPPVAWIHTCKHSTQRLVEEILSTNSLRDSGSKVDLTMPRERPRMGSRRGGSRGRSATQRPVNSPSSSAEIAYEHIRSSNRPVVRGAMRGWGEIPECGHLEHPAVRYRIPCTLENNTLIVSVMVEHCNNHRGPQDNLGAPVVDMQVPAVDMREPPSTRAPPATPMDEAGPSVPVQRALSAEMRVSQKLKGQVKDGEVLQKLKGPAKEEPQTTDED